MPPPPPSSYPPHFSHSFSRCMVRKVNKRHVQPHFGVGDYRWANSRIDARHHEGRYLWNFISSKVSYSLGDRDESATKLAESGKWIEEEALENFQQAMDKSIIRTTTTTASNIDISHHMLNLLTRCSVIVADVKQLFGYEMQ